MDEQGLWFGIICGLFVQLLLLMLTTLCTNWDNEVRATKTSALHFFSQIITFFYDLPFHQVNDQLLFIPH
jgi:hypothetical protein